MQILYRILAILLLTGASSLGWGETHTKDTHSKDVHTKAADTKASDTKTSNAQSSDAASAANKFSESKPAELKSNKILPSDVRVLIDVSGSMKQTDPQNLRKPALDLIVRLLPNKSRAGVWTFGNEVNMLIPRNMVDDNWRKQAAPKSEQINSVAMFTNIGKALDTVSFDRKNPSSDFKNHIILLTDGVVDINKDTDINTKERQRILTETLPALKNAGYIVHNIALSKSSDIELLQKISTSTDGTFLLANTADELMAAFLKIFDQAVPAERVPIENNGFMVDASVKEFTALIFRKPGVDQTIIAAPNGKEYSSTIPADGVNFYHTDKYDLITVDNPKVGQWKIKTDISPESRVTVVSNLQLRVQGLKNNIKVGDILNFEYSFQENGKTITNKDFLGVLSVNAIIAKEKTEENISLPLTSYDIPEDGIFQQIIATFNTAGNYEVHLYIDGKTFKREFKHSLSVRDTLLVLEQSNSVAESGKVTYSYKITTDEKIVDVKNMKLVASIKNSLNNNVENTLNLVDDNHWAFSFSPAEEADYTIAVRGQGETTDGDKIDETLYADKFSYRKKVAVKDEPKKEEPKKAEIKKEEPKPEAPKPEEKPVEEKSNLLLYISIAIGNLLLMAGAFLAYKKFMGGSAKSELDEYEKTLAMDKLPAKASSSTAATKPPEKTEIDLADEEPAQIPMNDDSSMDNLFPLDNMEDPKKNRDDEEF